MCLLKAMSQRKAFATWFSVRPRFLKSQPSVIWKICRQSFTNNMARRCPRSLGPTLLQSLVIALILSLKSFIYFSSRDNLVIQFFLSVQRYIYPEDQKVIYRQQSTQEPEQHQHRATGCAENHGGQHRRSSAAGRGFIW